MARQQPTDTTQREPAAPRPDVFSDDRAVPASSDHSRLESPPPGSDLARGEQRKTPPDRNRGRAVDVP